MVAVKACPASGLRTGSQDLEKLFDKYWLLISLGDRLFLAEVSAEPLSLSRPGESCLLRCAPSPVSRRAPGCPGAGRGRLVRGRRCQQGLYVTLPAEELTLEGFAAGGRADTMAPGPLLAMVLGAVAGEDGEGLAGLSDDQLIGFLSGTRRMESRMAWARMAALAEFASRPRRQDFASDEVASAFGLTWLSAAREIDYACTVARRLPVTFARWAPGGSTRCTSRSSKRSPASCPTRTPPSRTGNSPRWRSPGPTGSCAGPRPGWCSSSTPRRCASGRKRRAGRRGCGRSGRSPATPDFWPGDAERGGAASDHAAIYADLQF